MNTPGLTGEKLQRLFVHATNIHQGGGQALLLSIIESLPRSGSAVLILDIRMPLPRGIPESTQIHRISPTILQRIKAEKWLAEHTGTEDTVLCFGNLPPLFKLSGHTVVFVQNRYLVDNIKLSGFPLKARLRLAAERFWFSQRKEHADEFVVQTPTMKTLLETVTAGKAQIHIFPFMAEVKDYARSVPKKVQKKIDYDFLYVASGEPHKNHQRLIEAWRLLAEEGLFPSLCLTLNEARFAPLCRELSTIRQLYKLKVTNAGELSHNDINMLYAKVGALIYPSTFESLGLPLIEARHAGLPVLASELDFVRDVLDPEQTFDPQSETSIARAVKRFLGQTEQALPLLDASAFIKLIVDPRRRL
ncbi:glycosyltransferase [uncultured Desulfobulbus sp.]|uniref:glycosyltransferase n=1 Tax=uncultured Desulfobulbus sp. TaxID=239745 RepID=UPI0029C6A15E|nr:glycosyltransferase [uncultured Desulfobulbus sp.]